MTIRVPLLDSISKNDWPCQRSVTLAGGSAAVVAPARHRRAARSAHKRIMAWFSIETRIVHADHTEAVRKTTSKGSDEEVPMKGDVRWGGEKTGEGGSPLLASR